MRKDQIKSRKAGRRALRKKCVPLFRFGRETDFEKGDEQAKSERPYDIDEKVGPVPSVETVLHKAAKVGYYDPEPRSDEGSCKYQ